MQRNFTSIPVPKLTRECEACWTTGIIQNCFQHLLDIVAPEGEGNQPHVQPTMLDKHSLLVLFSFFLLSFSKVCLQMDAKTL